MYMNILLYSHTYTLYIYIYIYICISICIYILIYIHIASVKSLCGLMLYWLLGTQLLERSNGKV